MRAVGLVTAVNLGGRYWWTCRTGVRGLAAGRPGPAGMLVTAASASRYVLACLSQLNADHGRVLVRQLELGEQTSPVNGLLQATAGTTAVLRMHPRGPISSVTANSSVRCPSAPLHVLRTPRRRCTCAVQAFAENTWPGRLDNGKDAVNGMCFGSRCEE